MKIFHITATENIASIIRDGLQPAIGPRSVGAGEKRPQIYCFTSADAADDGALNWLGDALGDIPVSLLEIDASTLPLDIDPIQCAWEARISCAIPPHLILGIRSI